MGERYLIDTNVLIEFIGDLLPENSKKFIIDIVENKFIISVINKIEFLGYSEIDENIENFILLSEIIPLTDEIANETIAIKKKIKIKLPDAIIAATAIVNDLMLVTRNTKDFEKIENIKIINPYDV